MSGVHKRSPIKLRCVDPFLMLDEFNVGLPAGFPDHPHRGFEAITYMLPIAAEHFTHEDSCGSGEWPLEVPSS